MQNQIQRIPRYASMRIVTIEHALLFALRGGEKREKRKEKEEKGGSYKNDSVNRGGDEGITVITGLFPSTLLRISPIPLLAHS